MSRNRNQHVIPNCYLKAWCDPNTPSGQTPYIWRISKDGESKKRKSPEKSFVSPHRYTITLPNGDQNLFVENTLANLENKFVRIRDKIRRQRILTVGDRAQLCIFTAAMHCRTEAMGNLWKNLYKSVHSKVVALEQQRGAKPDSSIHWARAVETAYQDTVMLGLDTQSPLYFAMHMSILITDDPLGFITSDTPCVWRNPRAHTMPPSYRSPGLAQADIEVTLPLTPQHLLLVSHKKYPLYIHVPAKIVDEANRVGRWHCSEEFVSWKGETRPSWFERGEMPDDAWENTEEGKAAIKQQAKWDEMQKEHESRTGKNL